MKALIRIVFSFLALCQAALVDAQVLVMRMNGAATVKVGTADAKPLAGEKGVLPLGAVLQTGPDAMVVLGFPDGMVAVIPGNSTFRLTNYVFDKTQPDKSAVDMNLIDGGMRVALGEIGFLNPSAIRIQVGAATMGILSSTFAQTDASLVVVGGPVAVTVQDGRAEVRLPSGQSQEVSTGQGLYVGPDGILRHGIASRMADLVGQSAEGRVILRELAALQGTTQAMQQTVISLATLNQPSEQRVAPAFNAATTSGTAGLGGGGGGNIASPN